MPSGHALVRIFSLALVFISLAYLCTTLRILGSRQQQGQYQQPNKLTQPKLQEMNPSSETIVSARGVEESQETEATAITSLTTSSTGQCGWPLAGTASSVKQIHHGIYKVVLDPTGGNLLIAFKTECRPASKWHGQQGWSEVAAFAMVHLMFPQTNHSMPCAQGMIIHFADEHITEMHKDRCGLMSPSSHEVVGVALEWIPRHDDGGLPDRMYRKAFLSPYFLSPYLGDVFRAQHKETVAQISDILLLDYIDGNTDREDKNWFFSKDKVYIPMDNGWAFSGSLFEESVCGIHSETLRCPPLFKYLTGSRSCQGAQNCVFRKSSIQAYDDIRKLWRPVMRKKFLEVLRKDSLIQFLVTHYNKDRPLKKKGYYSTALARSIGSCEKDSTTDLLEMVSNGIEARLDQLQKYLAGHCKGGILL